MKVLIAALTFAALIAAPASAAVPKDRSDSGQSGQNYSGTYKGYPLSDWYRPDGY